MSLPRYRRGMRVTLLSGFHGAVARARRLDSETTRFIGLDALDRGALPDGELPALGVGGQSVDDLDLSVRAQNCLRAASIKTIGDLVSREESEMLKFRNFGRKSLQELVQVLEERNLRFGMDVDRYLEQPA